jgi:hypothetical protein
MAAGILLAIVGVFVILRTVRGSKKLPDLVFG